jgi:alpha-ketoglutarate-dependent 2,4-dichlorophenoxyacetate dioxygenase
MSIAIGRLHPGFAGEVSDIDLTRPINPEDVAAIDERTDQHAVMVFRGQAIMDEQQACTDSFGKLDPKRSGNITLPRHKRLTSGIGDLSNLDQNDAIISAEDRWWFCKLGNQVQFRIRQSAGRL